jgi:hypothetical protein
VSLVEAFQDFKFFLCMFDLKLFVLEADEQPIEDLADAH